MLSEVRSPAAEKRDCWKGVAEKTLAQKHSLAFHSSFLCSDICVCFRRDVMAEIWGKREPL